MQALFHDKITRLGIGLNDKLMAAQVTSHVKGVDGCAQVLANKVLFCIESDSFSNTLETALTSDVKHHFEADHI